MLHKLIETIDTKTALSRIAKDNENNNKIKMRVKTLNQFWGYSWITPSTKEFLSSMKLFIPQERKNKRWTHKKTITKENTYQHQFNYLGPRKSRNYIGGSLLYGDSPFINMQIRYATTLNEEEKTSAKLAPYVYKSSGAKDNVKLFGKGCKFFLYITPFLIISNIDSCNKTVEHIKYTGSVVKTEEVQRKKYERDKMVKVIHEIGTKQGERLAYRMMKKEYP